MADIEEDTHAGCKVEEVEAEFIKLDLAPDQPPQTMPVKPGNRVVESEIRLERCDTTDAERIAEHWYTCFSESWHQMMEPNNPLPYSTRVALLAKRATAILKLPHVHHIKAVHVPTSETIGIAGWISPSNPLHNPWRRSAVEHYDYVASEGWTDAEIEEMFRHIDVSVKDGQFGKDDRIRAEFFNGGPHWYLAPLMVWPEWQGKGVGRLLLEWGMEKSREDGCSLYLESAPTARAVYLHVGFRPIGEHNMVWRPGMGKDEGVQKTVQSSMASGKMEDDDESWRLRIDG